MGTLFLMRHGPTAFNEEPKRMRGWLDVPLAPDAPAAIAATIPGLVGQGIGRIVCSDLDRAHDTARLVGQALGLPAFPAFNLRPWDVGSLAGLTMEEGLEDMDYLMEHPSAPAPGGESWNDFLDRWEEALLQLVAAARQQSILAVTHHRNLLSAPTLLGSAKEIPLDGPPPPAGVLTVNTKTFRIGRLSPAPVAPREPS